MKFQRLISILLLILVGLSAIYGGTSLIVDPTGSTIEMPFHWILNSPFKDYFIPGLLLLIVIGLSSLAISVLTILRWKRYPEFIVLQGTIIVCWIVAQIMLLQVFAWIQVLIGMTGILLMLTGISVRGRLLNSEAHTI